MAKITLGDQQYTLVATGGAMRRIELLGELTLSELLQGHLAGRIKLEEAASIVHAGLEAGSPGEFEFGAVLDRLFELRITDKGLRRSIGEYLAELLYHPDNTGKRQAVMQLLERGGQPDDQPM